MARARSHGTLATRFPNLEATDFAGAGEEEGLEIWRVLKRKLVRAAAADEALGSPRVLRRSDFVVLLETRGDGRERTWTCYTWKGGNASMIAEGMGF